ncbi:MAG: CRTAC1 family protein, partial [Verrucomicrobiales bacterium]|nr:CRTAC1 family protein [Verrucomicrobiales bacterium]
STSFGISVADFDGDGHEDLFLAQNFFGVDHETSRQDAGRGLLLLGDGHGSFQALRTTESGISLIGEQRACAVADFDRDGRPDLAVGQHQGPLRLLHNRRGHPGVRVRLRGAAVNPAGIGARLRLRFAEGFGNLREVRAGTGYRSQDAFTQVLPTPRPPITVQVRWPNGTLHEWAWPNSALSISISEMAGPRVESTSAR